MDISLSSTADDKRKVGEPSFLKIIKSSSSLLSTFTNPCILSSIMLGIYALFGVETENDDDDSDSGSGGLMQPI